MAGYGGSAGTASVGGTGYGGTASSIAAKGKTTSTPKKSGPSILSRVMSVVGRPLNTVEGGIIGGAAGALHGAAGTQQYSGAQLADKWGVHNKWVRGALGFGLDVGLDPLTYLSFGASGVAKEGALAGLKGAEGAADISKAGRLSESVMSSGAQALKARRATEIGADVAKGGSTLWKPGMEVAKGAQGAAKAGETGGSLAGRILSKAPESAATGAKKLTVSAHIPFTKIGTQLGSSERAYNVLHGITSTATGSDLGNAVKKMFRTDAGLTPGISQEWQKARGLTAQDTVGHYKTIAEGLSGTTKAERKAITASIENGTVADLPEHLRPKAKFAQQFRSSLSSPGAQGVLPGLGETASKTQKVGALRSLPSEVKPIDEVLAHEAHGHAYDQNMKKFMGEVQTKHGELLKNDPVLKAQVEQTVKTFTPRTPESRDFLKFVDGATGKWKTLAVGVNPASVVKHMSGGLYLDFLAGVRNPLSVEQGTRLALGHEFAVQVGKDAVPSHDILEAYRAQGLTSGMGRSDLLRDGTGGKVMKRLSSAADTRENTVRLTNFVDALKTEGKMDQAAIEKAAQRVRKYNVTYGDLTGTEKQIRRVIPFYNTIRQTVPTMLETLMTDPSKITAVSKGARAMSQMLGPNSGPLLGPDNKPLPGMSNLPSWMNPESTINLGGKAIPLPFLTYLDDFMNPVEGVKGALSPAISVPWELSGGKTVQGAKPIQSRGSGLPGTAAYLAGKLGGAPGSLGAKVVAGATNTPTSRTTPPDIGHSLLQYGGGPITPVDISPARKTPAQVQKATASRIAKAAKSKTGGYGQPSKKTTKRASTAKKLVKN